MARNSEIQERLASLKQLRAAEEASPNRAQVYIDDLDLMIKHLEKRVDVETPVYEMVNK